MNISVFFSCDRCFRNYMLPLWKVDGNLFRNITINKYSCHFRFPYIIPALSAIIITYVWCEYLHIHVQHFWYLQAIFPFHLLNCLFKLTAWNPSNSMYRREFKKPFHYCWSYWLIKVPMKKEVCIVLLFVWGRLSFMIIFISVRRRSRNTNRQLKSY